MQQTKVECHSGFTYAQRPLRFQWLGEWQEVENIFDQWKTPTGAGFKGSTTVHMVFELYYHEDLDQWEVQDI